LKGFIRFLANAELEKFERILRNEIIGDALHIIFDHSIDTFEKLTDSF